MWPSSTVAAILPNKLYILTLHRVAGVSEMLTVAEQFPISAGTGNFPWFLGVYRRVFTHFRLILPVQNIKREKLCLPNAHY